MSTVQPLYIEITGSYTDKRYLEVALSLPINLQKIMCFFKLAHNNII